MIFSVFNHRIKYQYVEFIRWYPFDFLEYDSTNIIGCSGGAAVGLLAAALYSSRIQSVMRIASWIIIIGRGPTYDRPLSLLLSMKRPNFMGW
ncbi:hypothetical protein LMF89_22615 [Pelosinus sp. Bkl1]|uniref:Uncharacterized protein n=1 Tax=Pelosinus baikalensis TaxID=2892015 RepID=A0ABS8HY78_9FIRM|nr:hypothetical protein [Pelosinus baikalensis]